MTGFGGVTSGIRACRMVVETLKKRVSLLEDMVEDWSSEDDTVFAWAAYVSNEMDVQKDLAKSQAKHVGEEFVDMKIEVQSGMEKLRQMIESQ